MGSQSSYHNNINDKGNDGKMTIVEYDGKLKGYLTAVFEIYQQKINQASIKREDEKVYSLFGQTKRISSDPDKANRVWKKLTEKISIQALRQFYYAFLSGNTGMEDHLLGYIRYVLSSRIIVENNYAHPDVKAVLDGYRSVLQEKKQLQTFGRFQVARDQLHFLVLQPRFDSLPLLRKHYQDKFPDQRWILADSFRGYGFYFHNHRGSEIEWNLSHYPKNPDQTIGAYDHSEPLFKSLCNQELTNKSPSQKLFISLLPKNQWRHFEGTKAIHLSDHE